MTTFFTWNLWKISILVNIKHLNKMTAKCILRDWVRIFFISNWFISNYHLKKHNIYNIGSNTCAIVSQFDFVSCDYLEISLNVLNSNILKIFLQELPLKDCKNAFCIHCVLLIYSITARQLFEPWKSWKYKQFEGYGLF